jgi:hypothetical protein
MTSFRPRAVLSAFLDRDGIQLINSQLGHVRTYPQKSYGHREPARPII